MIERKTKKTNSWLTVDKDTDTDRVFEISDVSRAIKTGKKTEYIGRKSSAKRGSRFINSRFSTLDMEGIRRWFQGLSSSSSVDHGDVSSNDAVERPPPSSASTDEEQRELVITVDLDMSGLKPIKVPMRTNHRVATMDYHKVSRTRITDCNPVVAQIIIYSLSSLSLSLRGFLIR